MTSAIDKMPAVLAAHLLWRRGETGGTRADLRGAYLRDADLSGAYLRGADLRRADLRDADLCGADLCGADLSGAYLSGAYLSGADLSGAYLRGADLSGADLCGADLCGAKDDFLWSSQQRAPRCWRSRPRCALAKSTDHNTRASAPVWSARSPTRGAVSIES